MTKLSTFQGITFLVGFTLFMVGAFLPNEAMLLFGSGIMIGLVCPRMAA